MRSGCQKTRSSNHLGERAAAEAGLHLGHNMLRDKGCRAESSFGNCQEESLGI